MTRAKVHDTKEKKLSKREQQIMDVLYDATRATAREVHDKLPDAPSYSAVRTLLGLLEKKGHVRHVSEGVTFVYQPTQSIAAAGRQTLARIVKVFFQGSKSRAFAALIDNERLDEKEIDDIAALIAKAKKEKR